MQPGPEKDQIMSQFGQLPELSSIELPYGGKSFEYQLTSYNPAEGYVSFNLNESSMEREKVEYILPENGSEAILTRRSLLKSPTDRGNDGYISNVEATFFERESRIIRYHLSCIGIVQREEDEEKITSKPLEVSVVVDVDDNALQRIHPSSIVLARAHFGMVYREDEDRMKPKLARLDRIDTIVGGADKLTIFGHEPMHYMQLTSGITFGISDEGLIEQFSIHLEDVPILEPAGSNFNLNDLFPPYSYETSHKENSFTLRSTNKNRGNYWEVSLPDQLDVPTLNALMMGDSRDWVYLPQRFPVLLKTS